MTRTVAVTGLGLVTPLGTTLDVLSRSETATPPATVVDAGWPVHVVPTIPGPDDPRTRRHQDRVTQLAVAAAESAWEDAGRPAVSPEDAAVVIGTAFGGIATLLDQEAVLEHRGPRRVSPFMVPMMMGNAPAAHVSLALGWTGPSLAVVTDATSGSQAIGLAWRLVSRGEAALALAGGTEAPLVPLVLAGAVGLGFADGQDAEGRPTLGEGAVMAVLEPLLAARRRGARIYGVLGGYSEAEGPDAVEAAVRRVLAAADARPEHVAVLFPDASPVAAAAGELAALSRIFAVMPPAVPVLRRTGHLFGAAGPVQLAAACYDAWRQEDAGWRLVTSVGVQGQAAAFLVRNSEAGTV